MPSLELPSRHWHWILRICAFVFVLDVLGIFLAPPGSALRFACYVAFPCLMVAYLFARGRARPGEDFKDTPWGA